MSESILTGGQPAAAPVNTDPQQAGQPAAAPAAAAPTGWVSRITDPAMKEWATSKGWKDDTDPVAVADSYRNLEQLFGADKAGRTVVLPKDEKDTAGVDALFKKLGWPDKPDAYALKIDGANPEILGKAQEFFHKARLTPDQAKAVAEAYRGLELDKAAEVDREFEKQKLALKTEWGDKYDQRVETAKAAGRAAGMQDEHMQALELAWGPAAAVKFMEFFGRNYVEDGPPAQGARVTGGGLTPAAAEARISELRNDKSFMDRYNSRDPKIREEAIKQMDDLSLIAARAQRT